MDQWALLPAEVCSKMRGRTQFTGSDRTLSMDDLNKWPKCQVRTESKPRRPVSSVLPVYKAIEWECLQEPIWAIRKWAFRKAMLLTRITWCLLDQECPIDHTIKEIQEWGLKMLLQYLWMMVVTSCRMTTTLRMVNTCSSSSHHLSKWWEDHQLNKILELCLCEVATIWFEILMESFVKAWLLIERRITTIPMGEHRCSNSEVIHSNMAICTQLTMIDSMLQLWRPIISVDMLVKLDLVSRI